MGNNGENSALMTEIWGGVSFSISDFDSSGNVVINNRTTNRTRAKFKKLIKWGVINSNDIYKFKTKD